MSNPGPVGPNQQSICDGTANLPLFKINAYRKQWGLEPLAEDQVSGYTSTPTIVKHSREPKPRRTSPGFQRTPSTRKPSGRRGGGCSGCGGRKKPATLVPDGKGPGSKLLEMFEASGVPHCQKCIDLAARMDSWGVQGCSERLPEIVADILPRAKEWLSEERPWAHAALSATGTEEVALKLAVRGRVQQAMAAAKG